MSTRETELQWQAQRYVLDEMPQAERDAWERQLADDEAAQSAVLAATQLILALQLAPSTSAVPASAPVLQSVATVIPHSAPGRGAWGLALASTAAALVCLVFLQTPRVSDSKRHVAESGSEAAALVSLWRSGSESDADDLDESDETLDPAGAVAVPGWMLAAVSFEASSDDPVQEN